MIQLMTKCVTQTLEKTVSLVISVWRLSVLSSLSHRLFVILLSLRIEWTIFNSLFR